MIIIPEIEKVFIRIPRSGSGTLKNAIFRTYPRAFELYHHMEAGGMPLGYGGWQTVALLRDPIERMWSLYRFCKRVQGNVSEWGDLQRASVQGLDFIDWVLDNKTCFIHPVVGQKMYPIYSCLRMVPETRKTQIGYFSAAQNPTMLWPHERVQDCANWLGLVQIEHHNRAKDEGPIPRLNKRATEWLEHYNTHFERDDDLYQDLVEHYENEAFPYAYKAKGNSYP